MVFFETQIFTKLISDYLSDDQYSALQFFLIREPGAGKVIPGSGGIRKVRWGTQGKGKRGGLRVIYYWIKAADQIYMLLIYSKSEQDNLTKAQIKSLREVVEEELKDE